MKKLKMFVPLTKIDEEQRLVYGIATCEKKDRSGEICDYETSKPFYEKWSGEVAKASGGKSLGNVRAMHSKVAAGKLTQVVFNDDAKQIEVCAKVIDDAEWNKVKEGVYTGFSHGGSYEKVWKDADGTVRYTANPVELSLVDIPCLPDATFTAIKSDGAQEMRKFANVVVDPSMTQIGMKAEEMAKAAGDGHVWNEFTDAAHAALLQEQMDSAFDKAAEADDEDKEDNADDEEAEGDTSAKDKKDKKDKAKKFVEPQQVWKCNHPEHSHLAKAEAVSCMKQDEANDLAKEAVSPVNDALAKLQAALTPAPAADPVAEFVKSWKEGDEVPVEMADQMAEKLATDENLAKFLKDFDVQTSDVKSIMTKLKEYFIKPTEKPAPVAKSKDEVKKYLQKGLYQVSRLSCIIQDLEWLRCDVEFERQAEGDNSTLPEAIKANIASLCDSLKALVNEETAELLGEEDEEIVQDVIVVLEDAASVGSLVKVLGDKAPASLTKSLEKAVSPLEGMAAKFEKLRDSLPEEAKAAREQLDKCAGMCKSGARHSKKDVEMIQQMHDLATNLGAGCATDSTEKVAENSALRKQLNDLVPVIDQLTKQVEELRAQPVPAKAVTRVVSKSDDVSEGPGNVIEKAATELDKMTPDERAASLMKLALRNGVTLAK